MAPAGREDRGGCRVSLSWGGIQIKEEPQFLILRPFQPSSRRAPDSGHCSSWLCFPKLVDDDPLYPQLQALAEAQSFFRAQVKALGLAGRVGAPRWASWAGEDVATLAFLEWVHSCRGWAQSQRTVRTVSTCGKGPLTQRCRGSGAHGSPKY